MIIFFNDLKDDLDYTISEGYKVLDQLSNQLKEAIEILASSTQNDQFEYQDLVKFYHQERDRFRNISDTAKLKLQNHLIDEKLSYIDLTDVYSDSALIGQSLILIINAWNKKIHAKFELIKERKSGKSGFDSGVDDKLIMNESFEEISTEVFESTSQTNTEGKLKKTAFCYKSSRFQ